MPQEPTIRNVKIDDLQMARNYSTQGKRVYAKGMQSRPALSQRVRFDLNGTWRDADLLACTEGKALARLDDGTVISIPEAKLQYLSPEPVPYESLVSHQEDGDDEQDEMPDPFIKALAITGQALTNRLKGYLEENLECSLAFIEDYMVHCGAAREAAHKAINEKLDKYFTVALFDLLTRAISQGVLPERFKDPKMEVYCYSGTFLVKPSNWLDADGRWARLDLLSPWQREQANEQIFGFVTKVSGDWITEAAQAAEQMQEPKLFPLRRMFEWMAKDLSQNKLQGS